MSEPMLSLLLFVILYAQTPQVEESWLPHTLGGWLATIGLLFALSGAGSFAAVWKFLLKGVHERINAETQARLAEIKEERLAREQADRDEMRERQHDYKLLTDNDGGILARHKTGLKADIDAVGIKYNALELAATDREARVRELEGRMRDSEHDRAGMHKELGALQEAVKSFRDEQAEMRITIIDHIQQAKRETLAAVEKLADRQTVTEKEVAVIRDRLRRDGGEVT